MTPKTHPTLPDKLSPRLALHPMRKPRPAGIFYPPSETSLRHPDPHLPDQVIEQDEQ